jgi:hypothetical protein
MMASRCIEGGPAEIVVMSLIIRKAAAVALTVAIVAMQAQSASATSSKHRHHATATGQTNKSTEQYLRSASPEPQPTQR